MAQGNREGLVGARRERLRCNQRFGSRNAVQAVPVEYGRHRQPVRQRDFNRVAALETQTRIRRGPTKRPYRRIWRSRTQGDDVSFGLQRQRQVSPGEGDRRTEDCGAQSGHEFASIERENWICHDRCGPFSARYVQLPQVRPRWLNCGYFFAADRRAML